MVNISIDVTDLGGEARPGDKVTLWSPRVAGSASRAGGVVSTAPVTVFLTNGKATVSNVEPGDMRVLLQCRGVESQGPIDVVVPDGTGTVTLRSLIEAQFEYSPPIVSAVQQAADNAAASERAAIQAQVRSEAAADRAEARVDEAINNGANLIRAEVKQDADRAVSARQAAAQSESNAAASEGAAASSESNAKTSETNAKQSETNAGDYAAVATTAATEAVDAMDSVSDIIGANYATREYVDSTNWYRGVRPSSTNLDTVLENGDHIFISSPTNAPAPGIGTLRVVGSSSYKIQTWNRMGTNVSFSVHRRYYNKGSFTPWEQQTLRHIPIGASGDFNELVIDGYYPINAVSIANQPSSKVGVLWVVAFGTLVFQEFTDRDGDVFNRLKTSSVWGEWKRLGVDTLKLKDEIKTEVKGEINAPTRSAIAPATLTRSDVNQGSYPASMTADRTIYFNGQHSYGRARYSEDLGATWKNLKVFHGSFNFMEEVGDGELIARITGEERNEIWRSIGWPELRENCEWEKVLEAASPGVYFTNAWGVSIHKNIVLIAEYGPKYVPEALPGIPKQDTAEGENARYLNLSLDYGKTFRRILDINEYATSRKGDAINVHLHGVAWDPWWDRIWVTCGDGGGAFLYSDDMGTTWHTAWDGWAANASGGNGHQCVGIVPMPTCVLFATDSTPNGVMRINRSEGKHEGTYSPESAYMIPEDPGRLSHLAQRAYRVERDTGDYLAMFAFGTETMPGKSFALATYDGKNFERFWQDDQEVGVGRGARTMIGPTLDGKVFIGSNDRRTSNMWGLWQGKFNGY